MFDANTIANIVIAATSVIGAVVSLRQASRSSGSAKSAKETEQRMANLVSNTQNFAPQIHMPVTIPVTITATGAAEATAPLTPVVRPTIEGPRED